MTSFSLRTNMTVEVWISVLFSLIFSVERVYSIYSPGQETAIRTQIFTTNSYDYVSRPVAQTNIKVGLSILAIDELDLKSQSMTGAGWFTFEWEDSRLTWTPGSYADIEDIFQEQAKIWKPELVVDNSVDEVGVISDSNLYLRVNYLGKVEWEPPQLLEVHCEADITYYPYDRQICSVDIISWGFTVEEVTLEAASTGINLHEFEQNGEWSITKTTVELVNVSEVTTSGTTKTYPQIKFYVFLQRRNSFYNLNVMLPIICTSLLVTLVFVVPDESGEKLSYVLTVFLSIAVLMTLVADAMPPTSITVSVLGLYLAMVLLLSAIAILFTVGIMILAKRKGHVKSRSVWQVIARIAAKITCHPLPTAGKSRNTSTVSPTLEDVNDDESDKVIPRIECEWSEVSLILDKFCFILFTIVSIVMNLSFVIALTVGGEVNEAD